MVLSFDNLPASKSLCVGIQKKTEDDRPVPCCVRRFVNVRSSPCRERAPCSNSLGLLPSLPSSRPFPILPPPSSSTSQTGTPSSRFSKKRRFGRGRISRTTPGYFRRRSSRRVAPHSCSRLAWQHDLRGRKLVDQNRVDNARCWNGLWL